MEKAISIVHIMPQIGIGGAETQLCYLISNSPPEVQHEVLYYSRSRTKEGDEKGHQFYDKNNIKYFRVRRNKKRPIAFLRDLSKEIGRRNPDIVHCWLWSGNLWGRWAALLAGAKNIIVAYRNCEIAHPLIVRNLERFTKNRVHYLANSRAGADHVAGELGIAAERFGVIYNGIDVSRFDVSCRRNDVFARLDIPDTVKIVTMVGTLKEQKNYPMLLEIAAKCKTRNMPVMFMIAGYGDKERELKSLAESLGVMDCVHFLGVRDDVPEILKSSDYFCFTTRFEGLPNALLEAMAAGLPVITTEFDGVRELIEDNINGKIVPINDVDGACSALQAYLKNPKLADAYGKRARESVKERFSMEHMVWNTVQLYREICEDNAS